MNYPPDLAEALHGIGHRDHSITAEYRIFGQPGSGKTTNLTHQIQRAVQKYGESGVLAVSFSRAAAAELAEQDLPVNSDVIGTLHSHCWRALGRPLIAEANVEDWNKKHPQQRITPADRFHKLDGESGHEEITESRRTGDSLLSDLNRLRGTMVPIERWPSRLRVFASHWSRYKESTETMDFCDLIHNCVQEMSVAPGRPAVIFADEAQDLNPLQLRLVRQWGDHTEYFILAADDDQTIYSFTGATPDAVLDPPIPADHTIILRQTHRVSRRVHALANALIKQVTRRQPKLYEPREEDGSIVRVLRGGYKSPEHWILKTIMRHVEKGDRVMALASCSYMLNPIIAALRNWGIPFHNPYRKVNGLWNPLRLGHKDAAANRISSLLVAHPDWGDTSDRTTSHDREVLRLNGLSHATRDRLLCVSTWARNAFFAVVPSADGQFRLPRCPSPAR